MLAWLIWTLEARLRPQLPVVMLTPAGLQVLCCHWLTLGRGMIRLRHLQRVKQQRALPAELVHPAVLRLAHGAAVEHAGTYGRSQQGQPHSPYTDRVLRALQCLLQLVVVPLVARGLSLLPGWWRLLLLLVAVLMTVLAPKVLVLALGVLVAVLQGC